MSTKLVNMKEAQNADIAPRMETLVSEAAEALGDVYDPAGVLIFWSSRLTYLDSKRPCDVYRDGDLVLMERLVQRVKALADGAFA